MEHLTKKIIPSTFELWSVAFISVLILVIGNAHIFLQRYGLISSSTLVQRQLSHRFTSGLQALDTFTLTAGLVTFLTWGVIGMFVFSILQSIMRTTGAVKFERDLSSNQYVHPSGFNRSVYWHHIVEDTLLSFCLLFMFFSSAVLYVLFVAPVGFAYVQHFLLNVSLLHVRDLVLGLFSIFGGTLVVYTLLKLAGIHHQPSIG